MYFTSHGIQKLSSTHKLVMVIISRENIHYNFRLIIVAEAAIASGSFGFMKTFSSVVRGVLWCLSYKSKQKHLHVYKNWFSTAVFHLRDKGYTLLHLVALFPRAKKHYILLSCPHGFTSRNSQTDYSSQKAIQNASSR